MGSLPYESLPHDDTKGGARRHKLRIPHPAASVRLRSLRCASFFLGKRCAGLPRSGPCGAVLVSHRAVGNAEGFQRGQCPLCVVAEEGVTGEKPHRKGFSSRACFWLLFARAKSDPGLGRGGPGPSGGGGGAPISRRIAWYRFGKKNVSPPPARRWANLSPSVPCAGTAPIKTGVWGPQPPQM